MGRIKLNTATQAELLDSSKNKSRPKFKNRREGIFKKASELSTLCDVEVGVIILDAEDGGKPHTWPKEVDKLNKVVRKYLGVSEEERRKRSVNCVHNNKLGLGLGFGGTGIAEEKIKKSLVVEELSVDELLELVRSLDEKLGVVEEKIDTLKNGRVWSNNGVQSGGGEVHGMCYDEPLEYFDTNELMMMINKHGGSGVFKNNSNLSNGNSSNIDNNDNDNLGVFEMLDNSRVYDVDHDMMQDVGVSDDHESPDLVDEYFDPDEILMLLSDGGGGGGGGGDRRDSTNDKIDVGSYDHHDRDRDRDRDQCPVANDDHHDRDRDDCSVANDDDQYIDVDEVIMNEDKGDDDSDFTKLLMAQDYYSHRPVAEG